MFLSPSSICAFKSILLVLEGTSMVKWTKKVLRYHNTIGSLVKCLNVVVK